jgi:hypothetical protein
VRMLIGLMGALRGGFVRIQGAIVLIGASKSMLPIEFHSPEKRNGLVFMGIMLSWS